MSRCFSTGIYQSKQHEKCKNNDDRYDNLSSLIHTIFLLPSQPQERLLIKPRSVELQCHVFNGGPEKTLRTDVVIAAHAIA